MKRCFAIRDGVRRRCELWLEKEKDGTETRQGMPRRDAREEKVRGRKTIRGILPTIPRRLVKPDGREASSRGAILPIIPSGHVKPVEKGEGHKELLMRVPFGFGWNMPTKR